MTEEISIGDYVKILNHKFPNLNPKETFKGTVIKTPKEYREIQDKCKKNEVIANISKNITFEYKLKAIDYIGMIGKIINLREIAETKYEIDTGEIQKYVVEIKSKQPNWNGKRVTLFPSQVEKIYRQVKADKKLQNYKK